MGFADEGSGTEAVPKTSRKRAATSSLLQRTAKRRAQEQTDIGQGAAVATDGGRGVLESAGNCAAGAATLGGGSNNITMVIDGDFHIESAGTGAEEEELDYCRFIVWLLKTFTNVDI